MPRKKAPVPEPPKPPTDLDTLREALMVEARGDKPTAAIKLLLDYELGDKESLLKALHAAGADGDLTAARAWLDRAQNGGEPPKVDVFDLASKHAKQLALLRDRTLYTIVLCSRRAGKTYGLALLCLHVALSRPRQNILYLGLSSAHARRFLWVEIWLPLIERLGLGAVIKTNDQTMTTTFPNGSIMYISGTDDVRHIESYLGNRLNLAIVDEAQSQAANVLAPLCTRILPNALLDDMDNPGRLILSGTIPDTNAGYFMDVWNNGGPAWARHNWSRMENPYLTDQKRALGEYLKAAPGVTEESPIVQREWFGRFVFDDTVTAVGYSPDRNSWKSGEPSWATLTDISPGQLRAVTAPAFVDLFAVGIVPGTHRRWAVVLWGWSSQGGPCYHVAEWTTAKDAPATWGHVARVLRVLDDSYKTIVGYYLGSNISDTMLQTFTQHTGYTVASGSKVTDLGGQVQRLADLYAQRSAFVLSGSQLEKDCMDARWEQKARDEGRFEWSTIAGVPSVLDAARFAVQAYYDYAEPWEHRKTDAELEDERWRASMQPPTPDEAHWEGGDRRGSYGGGEIE